jgi:type I restriction enzyme S subunit
MSARRTFALEEVAEVFNGKTPSQADQRTEGYPVLKIRDVSEFGEFRGRFESFVDPRFAETFASKQVRDGDTLILNAAHNADYVGSKTYRAQPPTFGALATGEWLVVRPRADRLHPGFAHHWLTSLHTRRSIRDIVKGIHLYPKDVARLRIHVPPYSEQRRIAQILDHADALRGKRRAALAKLDSLTQSVFVEMFGDPVENQKGWPVRTLDSLAHKITDGTHKTPTYTDSGVTFMSAKDLKDGGIDWNTGKFIPIEEHLELIKRCKPERGDILLAKSGSLGSVAMVDRSDDFSLFESLCLMKHRRDLIEGIYLVWTLRNPSMLTRLLGKNKGIAIKHLHLVDIKSLMLPVPSIDLQRDFAKRAVAIQKIRACFDISLTEFDALFSSIQTRAFYGEL